MITILSWREGYRLSLAGIAGLIVAIGFTADSFIIYFERVRDELRDGRGLVGAVEAGLEACVPHGARVEGRSTCSPRSCCSSSRSAA